MSDRAFTYENIEYGGVRTSAFSIQCCKCEAKDYFAQTGYNRKPPIAAEQHFRNKGWRVGNGPRVDMCPECQKVKKPDLKVVEMIPEKPPAPRTASRDERLIIMDKIRDCHDGDRYLSGWSDKKVADDLGVPWAWIQDIRENVLLFPSASNEMFDEFLEKAAPIIAEIKNLFKSAQSQLEQARAIEARVLEIEKLAMKVQKEIGA